MAMGIFVFRSDELRGAEVLANYPNGIPIQKRTLMEILLLHDASEESGMIGISSGAVNLVSYSCNPEKGIYVVIILEFNEDHDKYEQKLIEICGDISEDTDPKVLNERLPQIFNNLT